MSIFTWANFLSFFRIAVTPLFIFMMLSKDGSLIIWLVFLFLVAAITDYFDGWLARKLKTESKFGRFFDPLADKISYYCCFCSVCDYGYYSAMDGNNYSNKGFWNYCT
jgi:CDP-diacylglycerol--glycerol-3-phosphate 3-phosphatidyltransferase